MAEQSQGLQDFIDSLPGDENEPNTSAPEQETDEKGAATEQEPAPKQLSAEEEKATRDGWKPKDEWQGDPDDWVSAKKFNERGDMIGQLKQLREENRQFNERLENQRKFMQAQQEQTIKELEAKRQEAVESADVDKFNSVQKQIDTLQQPEPPANEPGVKPDDAQAINDWNAANPWIFEDSEKANYAKFLFAQYGSQGMSAQAAIDRMQQQVNRQYPPQNPRRDEPSTSESPQPSPRGKQRETQLQWHQLTRDEVNVWNAMGKTAFGGDKKAFLQSVKDSRAKV